MSVSDDGIRNGNRQLGLAKSQKEMIVEHTSDPLMIRSHHNSSRYEAIECWKIGS
jgi:hypothetical protein